MDKEQRRRLIREDDREERELRIYVAHSLTSEMLHSIPGSNDHGVSPLGEVKTPAERQQEAAATAVGIPWMPHPSSESR